MKEINLQNPIELKNLIEENNESLRTAIQTLQIININTLQSQNQDPKVIPTLERNYPGYTTPVKYGFMSNHI